MNENIEAVPNDDGDDELAEAVTAADATGMVANEEFITNAEIAEGIAPESDETAAIDPAGSEI